MGWWGGAGAGLYMRARLEENIVCSIGGRRKEGLSCMARRKMHACFPAHQDVVVVVCVKWMA
jgi:hypothetical protein